MTDSVMSVQEKVKKAKARFCLEDGCRANGTIRGHCRLHYLSNWKANKLLQAHRAEKKLDDFVNRLAEKYPKDYLERLKEGLEDEEKMERVVSELDVDTNKENKETEREFLENFERKVKIE